MRGNNIYMKASMGMGSSANIRNQKVTLPEFRIKRNNLINRSIDVTSMNSLGPSLMSGGKSSRMTTLNKDLVNNSNFLRKSIDNQDISIGLSQKYNTSAKKPPISSRIREIPKPPGFNPKIMNLNHNSKIGAGLYS